MRDVSVVRPTPLQTQTYSLVYWSTLALASPNAALCPAAEPPQTCQCAGSQKQRTGGSRLRDGKQHQVVAIPAVIIELPGIPLELEIDIIVDRNAAYPEPAGSSEGVDAIVVNQDEATIRSVYECRPQRQRQVEIGGERDSPSYL